MAETIEHLISAGWNVRANCLARIRCRDWTLWLSRLCRSDTIVVLDASSVASGPAGRNSEFMIDLPYDLASADFGGALEHGVTLTADNRYAVQCAAKMVADFGLGAQAPARLPPRWIARPGANAALWWQERKAGGEL